MQLYHTISYNSHWITKTLKNSMNEKTIQKIIVCSGSTALSPQNNLFQSHENANGADKYGLFTQRMFEKFLIAWIWQTNSIYSPITHAPDIMTSSDPDSFLHMTRMGKWRQVKKALTSGRMTKPIKLSSEKACGEAGEGAGCGSPLFRPGGRGGGKGGRTGDKP